MEHKFSENSHDDSCFFRTFVPINPKPTKMKRNFITFIALVMSMMSLQAQNSYKWQNTQLPMVERMESLLGMLTPEEKVGLMMNKSISIDRLGIPSYNWWS
jgi:beta-glucosidase